MKDDKFLQENISIIIPFFQGNKYISSLVNRILNNVKILREKNCNIAIEIIIVNDSPEIKIQLSNINLPKNVYISIAEHEKNSGIHQARVTGLCHATGKYILFLDQDDDISDYLLWSQLISIDGYDVVVSNAYIEDDKHNKRLAYKSLADVKRISNVNCYIKSYNQILSPGQCLIKRECIPSEWKENVLKINGSDDLFLWILLLYKNAKVTYNNDILYTHVYTGVNLSNSKVLMYKSTKEIVSKLKNINYISSKVSLKLLRAHGFEIEFYKSNFFKKILLCFKNIDLIFFRAYWKIRRLCSANINKIDLLGN